MVVRGELFLKLYTGKNSVRTIMESQHVKGSKTPIKFPQQYYCHSFFNTLKENQFQYVSFSSIWNLETVC